jgi:hypothetical protein
MTARAGTSASCGRFLFRVVPVSKIADITKERGATGITTVAPRVAGF